jgi:radical SAM protein with 4Fe4S-binding SPASM domain
MIGIFDAWVENDDPSYYVRHIDNWLHLFFDLPPESCEYKGDCSRLLTVEWNGDVYPCDFFVDRAHRLGSVLDQTLEQMLRGQTFRAFVKEAGRAPGVCKGCEWFGYCRGGCYRHRGKLGVAPDAAPFLCEANKRIFAHAFSRLRRIKERQAPSGPGTERTKVPRLHAFLSMIQEQIAAGASGGSGTAARAGQAMSGADTWPGRALPRRQEARRGASQRNEPCPCGSGKKLKHCCGKVAGTSRGR